MAAKAFGLDHVLLLAILCIASPLEPKARKINWLSGTVADVGIYAKGATAPRNTITWSERGESGSRRKDLWWE